MVDGMTLQVGAVLLVATLIRSALGFGEALVAVPLLALIMPVHVAAPVVALVSITVAGVVLAQDWSEVHAPAAGGLVLSTLPGIPLGLLLLTRVPGPIVKAILACVIIAFSAYSLLRGRAHALTHDRLAWLFGFSAGVLGGAYSMNGPPLAIYGALRGWSPPGVLLAIVAGRGINRRLHGPRFIAYVYVGLIATGAMLLAQSLRR